MYKVNSVCFTMVMYLSTWSPCAVTWLCGTACSFLSLHCLSACTPCVHPVGCNICLQRVCVHPVCLCYPLGVCAGLYSQPTDPLVWCTVSTALLNNAKSLRLTTVPTQWGLSAQDIPSCIVPCCTFVPPQTNYYECRRVRLSLCDFVSASHTAFFLSGKLKPYISWISRIKKICQLLQKSDLKVALCSSLFFLLFCCRCNRFFPLRDFQTEATWHAAQFQRPNSPSPPPPPSPVRYVFQSRWETLAAAAAAASAPHMWARMWARPLSTPVTNVNTLLSLAR